MAVGHYKPPCAFDRPRVLSPLTRLSPGHVRAVGVYGLGTPCTQVGCKDDRETAASYGGERRDAARSGL